jgi:D-3-phosphoglycerate dehydrogenase
MRILVSDPLSEAGLRILQQEKDFVVDKKEKLSTQELKEIIKDYDALVVRSGTKVTKDIITRADNLKVIGRAGVGLDNIDLDAATAKGIIVMNSPGGNTISTAEHTMSLILALSRNIPQADRSLKEGKWQRSKFMGIELYGKTLGIVGLGRIGSEVAKRALSFGMRVVAYDRFLSEDVAKRLEVELVNFEDLLSQSDFISFHVPLTDDTRHMISDKEFSLMKKGVRIINCARGGIVDEAALERAIAQGKVAQAAIDVFEKEPPADSPLLRFDCVITTPHLGASTEEAQVNVAVEIAKAVRDALLGKEIRNAVNFPSLEPEAFKALEPYLKLAEKLGLLSSQLVEGRVSQVNITYSGEVIQHDVTPLTLALVKGLLTPVLEETVNFVNSLNQAKARGIKVREAKSSSSEEFTNLISLDVITEKETRRVCGTLFSKNNPRIVKIDDFYVEAIPSGYMLFTKNWDKPGVIGALGTTLGEHNINIAGMTFGRLRPQGEAITVLNIDAPAPGEILKKIRELPNVLDVKFIKL